MRIKTVLPFVAIFAISIWLLAHAGEEPKPAHTEAEASAEAKARADCDTAEKAAQEAEAAVVPLRAALQKADTEYANASKAAAAKRQQATDAKNLAGEPGAKELKQAEDNIAAAIKTLAAATNAKPAAEKALAEAKAAAVPLREAYDAADKVKKEAEAVAKAASDAANKLEDEAKRAAALAAVRRMAVDAAKAALVQAPRSLEQARADAEAAAQNLAEAEKQKKAADEAIAKAKSQVPAAKPGPEDAKPAEKPVPENLRNQATAATKALSDATAQKKLAEATLENAKKQLDAATAAVPAAEKAAQEAAKDAEVKKLVAAQVAAKRHVIAAAAAALAKAQLGEEQAQVQANDAAKALADATTQKKTADAALDSATKQVAAATAALAAAEKAAQEAEAKAKQISTEKAEPDAVKEQAAADAAARRKAAVAAKAALAQAQQSEQKAQAPATAAAQKLAAAKAQKKAADDALASAKTQVSTATAANQAAVEAAKELAGFEAASKQAADDLAAKRKALAVAASAFNPVQRKLEQAALQANLAAQSLSQAEARKKAAEEALENLKKRIASAKQTWQADEQAAQQAEAATVPLKAESDKARTAYEAAMKIADGKRALVQQAKAGLYRLTAAREVGGILESPDPPKPANRIDEIVFAKLKALGIKPVLCSDAVFVRRAYLDLTGKLPSADEAKEFIQSSDRNKRVALVDRLLDQSAHTDYWAMKWSDVLRIKAEFPVKVWPNAAQAYYRWVWESIAQNKPYDQFVRELLTSSGSNFRVGPVNFYRAIQDRTPEGAAAAVGLTLMGARLHLWPEERRASMAVFFSQLGYKSTSEWKEEIVFWDPLKSAAVPGNTAPGVDTIPKSVTASNQIPQGLAEPISENAPLAAVFPDGAKTTVPPDRDPREVFAEWLIRPENPWFAKNIVNRTWAWVMGRGIIHDTDDIRSDNPASNPELLAYLEKELVSNRYDLKHLKRLIFTSTTYQFSPVPRVKTPEARANFASYPWRRVEAEVLINALNNITGSSDLYTTRGSGAVHVHSQRHVRGGTGRWQRHQLLLDVVRAVLAVHGDGR